MTIEEKARAYDKAIEKIKYVMEHGVQPVLNKEDLQDIFSELAEPEDERIRKALIGIISNYVDDSNTFKPKMLAWLEKQALEAKPKWTEDDEFMMKSILVDIEYARRGHECMDAHYEEERCWLKELKQRMEEQLWH